MDNEEALRNMELQQEAEHDMEGEDYDDDFVNENGQHMSDPMEGEGEGYDEEEQDDMQNPYDQADIIRNTFYPPQNQMMAGGFGGALRPVSANVPKEKHYKKGLYDYKRGKNRIAGGFSKGLDAEYDIRTRPTQFTKDREGLYDDAIKLKKAYNNLRNENIKYKTRVK